MNIGITGHQDLSNGEWVKQEIDKILRAHSSVVGFSSLAVGADQLFAQSVIDCDGELNVILPMKNYEAKFKEDERAEYERLLTKAISTQVMPPTSSDEESYFSAGKRIVELCDLLIAVWDGKPAAGLGGTGDVVKYAEVHHKPFIQINPEERIVKEAQIY